jgi:F-type H+-transporting ATPase subunit delta
MATVDDSVIAIADSYATALLELAEESGVSQQILDELAELTAGLRWDDALRDFLSSAAVDDDERARVMERVFRGKMSDLLLNTLLVMNSKGRSSIIPVVHERYRLALSRVRGELDVKVTTALPLNRKLRNRLVEVLGQVTGKKPVLVETVDESVLGGLAVQIGDEKLDGTVARRLELLRESFRHRASREIHAGSAYFEGADA